MTETQCIEMDMKPVILVVDDTPVNIQILAQALVKKYEIRVATSGQAALEIMRRDEKPDLVLLDVMMPIMDGYEVCRRMKLDQTTKNIPLIFVSAKGEVADQQHGFDLGAVDYITKPFDLPIVFARVNVHVRLKQKSEQLERLALIDGLTDIPNRRSLEDAIHRECGRCHRDGKPLSLLMIDVDHFKAFNDHYGHGAGDECLRSISHALVSHIQRAGDLVGRYGGEEFVVLLPDSDKSGALVVANKLRDQVEKLCIPHQYFDVADHITISIGVKSLAHCTDSSRDELLTGADQALYLAKRHGRNQVTVSE